VCSSKCTSAPCPAAMFARWLTLGYRQFGLATSSRVGSWRRLGQRAGMSPEELPHIVERVVLPTVDVRVGGDGFNHRARLRFQPLKAAREMPGGERGCAAQRRISRLAAEAHTPTFDERPVVVVQSEPEQNRACLVAVTSIETGFQDRLRPIRFQVGWVFVAHQPNHAEPSGRLLDWASVRECH
jgi:hypothetical protein